MARRRGNGGTRSDGPGEPRLNAPFRDLARHVRARPRAAEPPRPTRGQSAAPPPAPPDPPADDATLFSRAMGREGVAPLPRERHRRLDPPPPTAGGRPPVSDEAETLAALSELVAGAAHFDVTNTREDVEGSVQGLDPRLLKQLRRGDFAWQAYLDLHGMTAAEARPAVAAFVAESLRGGRRCVLIVHGRGHNSRDHTPVLKGKVVEWLSRGSTSRTVLAFTTARPHDGGAGALYVLLRRDRRRRPIRVTSGAES